MQNDIFLNTNNIWTIIYAIFTMTMQGLIGDAQLGRKGEKPERYQWKKPEWNKAEGVRPKEQARIIISRLGLRQNASSEQGRIFHQVKKSVYSALWTMEASKIRYFTLFVLVISSATGSWLCDLWSL
jgi:hypothetical protein